MKFDLHADLTLRFPRVYHDSLLNVKSSLYFLNNYLPKTEELFCCLLRKYSIVHDRDLIL